MSFIPTFTLGHRHTFKGRTFVLTRFEPYTRKDGTGTVLAYWRAACSTCGADYEIATPEAFDPEKTNSFYSSRCAGCKRLAPKNEISQRRHTPLAGEWRALVAQVVEELSLTRESMTLEELTVEVSQRTTAPINRNTRQHVVHAVKSGAGGARLEGGKLVIAA